MRKKYTLVLIIFAIASAILSGCTAENTAENKKEKINSIVSLNPDITEIIFALGANDKLVGRSDYCTYPKEAESIDSIGDTLTPNIEKIVALEPDIVLCSSMMMQENIDKLTQVGLKVEIMQSLTISDVEANIKKLGELLGKEEKAEQIVTDMENTFDSVRNKATEALFAPTVYFVVGFGEYGEYTAGGNTFVGELIKMAGGINIAEDVTDWKYSLEKIVENDPFLILVSSKYGADKELVNANGYKDLSAIKENRLYAIDEDVVSIAGPRLAQGAELLLSIFEGLEN